MAVVGEDDMSDEIKLTREEQTAIRRLQALADKWPQSLTLFSWSGVLRVLKLPSRGHQGKMGPYVVARIDGIPNDGGDPD